MNRAGARPPWAEKRLVGIAFLTALALVCLTPGVRIDGLDAGRPSLRLRLPVSPPLRELRAHEAITTTASLFARRENSAALDRLSKALENDPREPHLAIQLEEILLATGQMAAAAKWLKEVESMDLPSELMPRLRRARFALRREP